MGYLYKFTRFKLFIFELLTAVDWCGDPPEVQGASVTATGRKAGSVAVYSCHQGFVAVGGQQVSVVAVVVHVILFLLRFYGIFIIIYEGAKMRTWR